MSWFSKLVTAPIRLLNVPMRVTEKLVARMSGDTDIHKQDRILSVPLDILADTIEDAVDGKDE